MNINALFPSKFVAAGDLVGQDVTVTIASISQEEVGNEGERRPVLYFVGMSKGMVLNRTNAKRIAKNYGTECDAWIGKAITLYPSETEYAGDTVPCIRVRTEVPGGVPASVVPAAPPPPPVPQPAVMNGGPRF